MPDKPEKIKLALCVRTELPDSSNSWQGCAYAHLHVSLYASEVDGDAPGRSANSDIRSTFLWARKGNSWKVGGTRKGQTNWPEPSITLELNKLTSLGDQPRADTTLRSCP